MQKLRFLPFVAVLAFGATISAQAVGPTTTSALRYASFSYQDGYNQGYNETLQNKCIDGTNFELHYQNNYLPRAQQNYYDNIGTADEAYYQGYLGGLQDGHDAPVSCG